MYFRRWRRREKVYGDCRFDRNEFDDATSYHLPDDSVEFRLWGVRSQADQDAAETRTGGTISLCLDNADDDKSVMLFELIGNIRAVSVRWPSWWYQRSIFSEFPRTLSM